MQDGNLPVEIDVKSVKAMLDGDDEFVLLDCREPDEYEFVKLNGAQHIPIGEISTRLVELNGGQDDRIVVYCHHGSRSLMVTQFLRQQGFDGAQNMSGGIDAWAVEIDPSLPRY
jgi:rhodanese-related sulfurtransferase